MTTSPVGILESNEDLRQWCEKAQGVQRIAVDTEGDSLHCYFEKLCLIQLSTVDQDLIIDPLVPLEFAPLLDLLQRSVTIFHGCDYDLRMLRRGIGFVPGEIFDTYLAARLVGLKEVGLASLVQHFFQIDLPKSSQKANWARRPLTATMVEYAVNDTRYLSGLAEILEGVLRQKGRWPWYEESCRRAVLAASQDRERDPEKAWKISGSAALSPRGLAILRLLWLWRENEAQKADRPTFQIVRNEDLVKFAGEAAADLEPSLPNWLPNARKRRLLEAVHSGKQLPSGEWPQKSRSLRLRPTPEHERRFERLRQKRDLLAAELELEPSVIASRQALERAARDAEENDLMVWQRNLLEID